MSINQLLNKDLFSVYEMIFREVNDIKNSSEDLDGKKRLMSKLLNKYQDQLKKFKQIAGDFSKSFMEKFNLNDQVISARIGSPTPYGNQPKSYLWSGISIDKEKSYSFQYSWVFQPSQLEVTFCFGSGVSATGKVDKEILSNKERNIQELQQKLIKIINEPNRKSILEKLINEEKFVITSEWLKTEGNKSTDINKFIEDLKNNNGAKSGITRYFQKEELLSEGFNLEEEIYKYFELFKPIWDDLHQDFSTINYSPEGKSNNEVIRDEKEKYNKFPTYTNQEIISHIYTYIASKGFYYQKEEVINLYLSLKTKPFVILSGISGTGKTKMVQWFAESVGATEENGQFALIPIRPDWNDGSDLLGYRDIKGEFQKGPLTKVFERALNNPELPYFVLLDEMNLARVEYYFSDVLSVMESRKWEDGEIVSSNLLTKEHADVDLKLPNNVYIIGTVNMDETTHPFSKKVLDRANTIEFNRVELDYLEFLKDLAEIDPVVIGQESFASNYLHLKDVYVKYPSLVERVTRELVEINKALQLINAHVGYRVRDEICFYLAYNQEAEFMTFEKAMDHCLLQKVLPRIAGSDQRVEDLLKKLFLLFANKPYDESPEQVEINPEVASYPRSAAKVAEMLRGLRDGFTSFWIS